MFDQRDCLSITSKKNGKHHDLTNWVTWKTYNINSVFIFQCTIKYVPEHKWSCSPACLYLVEKNDLITVLLPVSDKESKKYFFCKSYVHPTLNHERHTCTVMTIYKEWKGDWMNNLSLPAVDQKPNLQNKAVYTCISFIKVRKNWNIDCGRHMYSHVFSKISFITFFPS